MLENIGTRMATLKSEEFGIQMSDLPLINLRIDFNNTLALFRSERFRSQFSGHNGKKIPINTHYFTWHGRPSVLLSHLLRNAIVSIESAVSGAVIVEALARNMASRDVLEATKNPFSLRGQGTADCVYNLLPKLIDHDYALMKQNEELWEQNRIFYREVRNPLFHAYEVANNPEAVLNCLEHINDLFVWLNSWHSLENALTGGSEAEDVPELDDLRASQFIVERNFPEESKRVNKDLKILNILQAL